MDRGAWQATGHGPRATGPQRVGHDSTIETHTIKVPPLACSPFLSPLQSYTSLNSPISYGQLSNPCCRSLTSLLSSESRLYPLHTSAMLFIQASHIYSILIQDQLCFRTQRYGSEPSTCSHRSNLLTGLSILYSSLFQFIEILLQTKLSEEHSPAHLLRLPSAFRGSQPQGGLNSMAQQSRLP